MVEDRVPRVSFVVDVDDQATRKLRQIAEELERIDRLQQRVGRGPMGGQPGTAQTPPQDPGPRPASGSDVAGGGTARGGGFYGAPPPKVGGLADEHEDRANARTAPPPPPPPTSRQQKIRPEDIKTDADFDRWVRENPGMAAPKYVEYGGGPTHPSARPYRFFPSPADTSPRPATMTDPQQRDRAAIEQASDRHFKEHLTKLLAEDPDNLRQKARTPLNIHSLDEPGLERVKGQYDSPLGQLSHVVDTQRRRWKAGEIDHPEYLLSKMRARADLITPTEYMDLNDYYNRMGITDNGKPNLTGDHNPILARQFAIHSAELYHRLHNQIPAGQPYRPTNPYTGQPMFGSMDPPISPHTMQGPLRPGELEHITNKARPHSPFQPPPPVLSPQTDKALYGPKDLPDDLLDREYNPRRHADYGLYDPQADYENNADRLRRTHLSRKHALEQARDVIKGLRTAQFGDYNISSGWSLDPFDQTGDTPKLYTELAKRTRNKNADFSRIRAELQNIPEQHERRRALRALDLLEQWHAGTDRKTWRYKDRTLTPAQLPFAFGEPDFHRAFGDEVLDFDDSSWSAEDERRYQEEMDRINSERQQTFAKHKRSAAEKEAAAFGHLARERRKRGTTPYMTQPLPFSGGSQTFYPGEEHRGKRIFWSPSRQEPGGIDASHMTWEKNRKGMPTNVRLFDVLPTISPHPNSAWRKPNAWNTRADYDDDKVIYIDDPEIVSPKDQYDRPGVYGRLGEEPDDDHRREWTRLKWAEVYKRGKKGKTEFRWVDADSPHRIFDPSKATHAKWEWEQHGNVKYGQGRWRLYAAQKMEDWRDFMKRRGKVLVDQIPARTAEDMIRDHDRWQDIMGGAEPRERAFRPNLNRPGHITAHELKRSGAPDYSRSAASIDIRQKPITLENVMFDLNKAGANRIHAGAPKHPMAGIVGTPTPFNPDETIMRGQKWKRIHYNPRIDPNNYLDDEGKPVVAARQAQLRMNEEGKVELWADRPLHPISGGSATTHDDPENVHRASSGYGAGGDWPPPPPGGGAAPPPPGGDAGGPQQSSGRHRPLGTTPPDEVPEWKRRAWEALGYEDPDIGKYSEEPYHDPKYTEATRTRRSQELEREERHYDSRKKQFEENQEIVHKNQVERDKLRVQEFEQSQKRLRFHMYGSNFIGEFLAELGFVIFEQFQQGVVAYAEEVRQDRFQWHGRGGRLKEAERFQGRFESLQKHLGSVVVTAASGLERLTGQWFESEDTQHAREFNEQLAKTREHLEAISGIPKSNILTQVSTVLGTIDREGVRQENISAVTSQIALLPEEYRQAAAADAIDSFLERYSAGDLTGRTLQRDLFGAIQKDAYPHLMRYAEYLEGEKEGHSLLDKASLAVKQAFNPLELAKGVGRLFYNALPGTKLGEHPDFLDEATMKDIHGFDEGQVEKEIDKLKEFTVLLTQAGVVTEGWSGDLNILRTNLVRYGVAVEDANAIVKVYAAAQEHGNAMDEAKAELQKEVERQQLELILSNDELTAKMKELAGGTDAYNAILEDERALLELAKRAQWEFTKAEIQAAQAKRDYSQNVAPQLIAEIERYKTSLDQANQGTILTAKSVRNLRHQAIRMSDGDMRRATDLFNSLLETQIDRLKERATEDEYQLTNWEAQHLAVKELSWALKNLPDEKKQIVIETLFRYIEENAQAAERHRQITMARSISSDSVDLFQGLALAGTLTAEEAYDAIVAINNPRTSTPTILKTEEERSQEFADRIAQRADAATFANQQSMAIYIAPDATALATSLFNAGQIPEDIYAETILKTNTASPLSQSTTGSGTTKKEKTPQEAWTEYRHSLWARGAEPSMLNELAGPWMADYGKPEHQLIYNADRKTHAQVIEERILNAIDRDTNWERLSQGLYESEWTADEIEAYRPMWELQQVRPFDPRRLNEYGRDQADQFLYDVNANVGARQSARDYLEDLEHRIYNLQIHGIALDASDSTKWGGVYSSNLDALLERQAELTHLMETNQLTPEKFEDITRKISFHEEQISGTLVSIREGIEEMAAQMRALRNELNDHFEGFANMAAEREDMPRYFTRAWQPQHAEAIKANPDWEVLAELPDGTVIAQMKIEPRQKSPEELSSESLAANTPWDDQIRSQARAYTSALFNPDGSINENALASRMYVDEHGNTQYEKYLSQNQLKAWNAYYGSQTYAKDLDLTEAHRNIRFGSPESHGGMYFKLVLDNGETLNGLIEEIVDDKLG